MEVEVAPKPIPPFKSSLKTATTTSRSASRLRYEVEADLIRKKIGDLEPIRGRLGLSRRKICQLLLVDPSAWTRWTSGVTKTPPHIFRALEWYLLLTEKDARALMPIGTWSSNAFEDRFQGIEIGLAKTQQVRQYWAVALVLVGILLGLLLGALIFHAK